MGTRPRNSGRWVEPQSFSTLEAKIAYPECGWPAHSSLALRPIRSPSRQATLYTESSDSLVVSDADSIATGWSEPVHGWELRCRRYAAARPTKGALAVCDALRAYALTRHQPSGLQRCLHPAAAQPDAVLFHQLFVKSAARCSRTTTRDTTPAPAPRWPAAPALRSAGQRRRSMSPSNQY